MQNYNATPQLPPNGFTIAEMFCGGGLMAMGLKAAGYSLIWANDFDKNAVKAYAANIGPHVIQADITEIDADDIPDSDIIAGGPPCQDFSVAGLGAGEMGDKGRLVWTYLDKIKRKQPKAFIFENVKGLILKKHISTFEALLSAFDDIGYTVSWKLINSWDYGVAQKRERVFIVGIRKDLGFAFEFPKPDEELYRTQVLRNVIGDLPEPGVKLGINLENHTGGVPMRSYPGHTPSELNKPAKTIVAGTNGVPGGVNCFCPENHIQTQATTVKPEQLLSKQRSYTANWEAPARTVNTSRLDHAEIHPGMDNHNEKSYWYPKSEYTYDQANRVQSMEGPSNTIPAHHNSGQPIHPTQHPRRFTVRECLRIQSVPDHYVIPEDIKLSPAYRIVGNGVATRVAYILGQALADQLKEHQIQAAFN